MEKGNSFNAAMAQQAAQRADNAEVVGSSPAGGTKYFVGLLSRKPSTMDFECMARSRIVMDTL